MKKGFNQVFNYDYYVIGDLISGEKNKDTPVQLVWSALTS